MSDDKQVLHTDMRQAVDALARALNDHRLGHPGEPPETWFDGLRRMVEARAASLRQVARLGAMGGGGPDEA